MFRQLSVVRIYIYDARWYEYNQKYPREQYPTAGQYPTKSITGDMLVG